MLAGDSAATVIEYLHDHREPWFPFFLLQSLKVAFDFFENNVVKNLLWVADKTRLGHLEGDFVPVACLLLLEHSSNNAL